MSANLNLTQVVEGMAAADVAINTATAAIDAAITETLTVDLTNNVTLTAAQWRSAVRFNVTPAGVTKTLTLQAIKRMVYINNASTNAISLTLGTTTLALAASAGGFFYTDGTANGLAQLASSGGGGAAGNTAPFDIGLYVPGLPGAASIVWRFNVLRAFTWPINLTGSVFNARVAATGTSVFTIKQNGTAIGTLSYAAAGTVPTVSFTGAVTFAVNDVITITAPASQDATLADISFNFNGSVANSTTLVPFDMNIFINGKPGAAATILRFNVVRQFLWKAALTGSVCNAGVAATASTVFTIKQNGTTIGTITFAISGTTGTISFTADVFFAVNDVITIVAPAQDATLADIAFNLFGSR